MTPIEIVVIIVVVIAIAVAVGWYVYKRERSRKLFARFGPEYDRAVERYGSRARAEDELLARQHRMEKVHIRRLTEADRDQFSARWQQTQAHFVDDPPGTIHDADRLVCEVMRARGYPVSDFEQQAEDLSVDHPLVIKNYRLAHEIALRQEAGEANTEDLRQALVRYRDLFDELLEVHAVGPRGGVR
jgi:FtsZ-interacting cell division protein ZipA